MKVKWKENGRANDSADFYPPAFHTGWDGARCTVSEVFEENTNTGEMYGHPIALIVLNCDADDGDALQRTISGAVAKHLTRP